MKVTDAQAVAIIEHAARVAAVAAADQIHSYAIALTPLGETGELRSTSTVVPDSTKPRAEVVYPKIYAARQHEETTWNHPKAGQAKYLQTAAVENTDFVTRLVQSHMREAL